MMRLEKSEDTLLPLQLTSASIGKDIETPLEDPQEIDTKLVIRHELPFMR